MTREPQTADARVPTAARCASSCTFESSTGQMDVLQCQLEAGHEGKHEAQVTFWWSDPAGAKTC